MQTKVLKIVLFLSIICCFIPIIMLFKAMHDDMIYKKEHPCVKTETKRICHTYERCQYGIMLPGFCITKEETRCYDEVYCVERK